jgi:Holliday junction resolvase RusA-like endonuclease
MTEVARFDVEIPMPPSLNGAYANMPGVGRVKVTSYRRWQDAAIETIQLCVPERKRISGTVNVHILLPLKMRGDCDNRIKPVLDALVKSGRIDDDRNIQWVSARKCLPGKDNALVKVEAAL